MGPQPFLFCLVAQRSACSSSEQLAARAPVPPRPSYYKEIKDLVYLSQRNTIWLQAALPGLLSLPYRTSAYVKI